MIPQPKSKFDEMLSSLDRMSSSQDVNLFQLKKIKKEAEILKEVNTAEAFALLGIVACMENDIEATHRTHKNSLHYDNSIYFKHLYASSLLNLHQFEDAYEYAKELYEADKSNKGYFNDLIWCLYYLNKDDELNESIADWKKLTGEDHPLIIKKKLFFLEDIDKHIFPYYKSNGQVHRD